MKYQKQLDKTKFIILGFMYEKKPLQDIERYKTYIPEEYQKYFGTAVDALVAEEYITGENVRIQKDGYNRIAKPTLTEKGKQWYIENKPLTKWKRLLNVISTIKSW